MNKILEGIKSHPGLYLGHSNRSFTSLAGFLGGYECGFAAAIHGHAKPEELVPDQFNKFVTEKFGEHFPAGGKGWQIFIEENTSSEKEAFELFFELREEYDQKFHTK